MRYAIYTRYSAEQQTDISLEAQERQCRNAVQERGGTVVQVYQDVAKTGWSLDRPGFKAMRADAEQGLFDAIMFWKFDRLARDHNHALIIKMLLRHDYGIKLYCVEGFSEDDDNSPYAAMMEQMFAVFSAYYSYNLSTEAKRSKYERVMRGEFNGSIAPLGYDLITRAQETPDHPAGLYVNIEQAVLVRKAFELYSTGKYSDTDIAQWLNEQPLVNKLREGSKPIGASMTREMLQSQIYLGKVQYKETQWHGTLGEDRKNVRSTRQWYEGKHEAIISTEIFDICRNVRAGKVRHRNESRQLNTYILNNKVYCVRCIIRTPSNINDEKYGKMRASYMKKYQHSYYRCMAKYRGYTECDQQYIPVKELDLQMLDILKRLRIPDPYRNEVETSVQARINEAASQKRLSEIENIAKQIDFSWQNFDPTTFQQKREQLENDWKNRPENTAQILQAPDLIDHFADYWGNCRNAPDTNAARQHLIDSFIYRIYVYDERIVMISLYGGFTTFTPYSTKLPYSVALALEEFIESK